MRIAAAPVHSQKLAVMACAIEIICLGNSSVKQDEYRRPVANFTCLTFERAHRVAAEPLRISIKTPFDLQDNLLFFVGHQQPGDRQMALTGYGQWRDRRQVGRRRGSGFLMFYATDPGRLRQAMADAGMDEVPFRFEFEGTKIILS